MRSSKLTEVSSMWNQLSSVDVECKKVALEDRLPYGLVPMEAAIGNYSQCIPNPPVRSPSSLSRRKQRFSGRGAASADMKPSVAQDIKHTNDFKPCAKASGDVKTTNHNPIRKCGTCEIVPRLHFGLDNPLCRSPKRLIGQAGAEIEISSRLEDAESALRSIVKVLSIVPIEDIFHAG